MTDPIKTTTEVIPPVSVAIIGGTGDGGAPLTSNTLATTPDHQPNLIVTVIQPVVAILVRFVNLFLTTLVGLVMAGMTPAGGRLLYTGDFLHMFALCASLAFPGAAVGLVKDCITVFGRMEQKFPLATGSI